MLPYGRWVNARDLKVGDELLSRSQSALHVLSLNSRNETTTVYNLTIADYHTYAVGFGETLVHNKAMEAVSKSTSKVWNNFKSYRGNVKTNGLKGSAKQYYQWDYTHNHIEVFDSNGAHIGVMSGVGEKPTMIGPAVKGRNIKDLLR
jgi:hypothetical protein